MKIVSGKHFCKVLERHGWVLQRVAGSHHVYRRPNEALIVTVQCMLIAISSAAYSINCCALPAFPKANFSSLITRP